MRREGAEGESANKSAGWSGEDSDEAATYEDVTTTGGAGWDGKLRMATSRGTQESGMEGRLGDAMADGGDTGKATSAAADKAGAGGRHGARPAQR